MKKIVMLAFALSLAIILAACGDDAADENENEGTEQDTAEQAQNPVEVKDEEKVDEKSAVVSVNGDEIKGDKYNPIYLQVKTQMQQAGEDVSNLDQLKEQTINVLVEQQLIKQAAKDKGLEVTEEEVQSEFSTLKEENAEQLSAVLEQFQLTEENFKTQLADDLITQKFIDSELDIKVTDEEIAETYDQLKEQNEEIAELEAIEEQLKQTLENQKIQEQLQAQVEKLRKNAEVETLI